MAWWDFYKLWTYQFEKGPIERLDTTQISGAGVVMPDAMPDLRGDSYGVTQSQIRLYDSNDFIDLSSVTNRQSRYKEYERLRAVAEVEMAMTVISDEACIHGSTRVATLFDGMKSIRWLTERWQKDQSPFLVYSWSFDKEDYTLGWAYEPRVVKKSETIKILLDDGGSFTVTPDHRILTRNQEWVNAEDLEIGSELMPFYRLEPNKQINKLRVKQFPRIFTFDGWKHERQFIDEWRDGKGKYKKISEASRLIAAGAPCRDVETIMKHSWKSVDSWIKQEGFCTKELKWLGKRKDRRRVVGILPGPTTEVYDLSVKQHENFCTDSAVMHNCQRNENNDILKIHAQNEQIKKELEFLCFNRKMLNLNRKVWQMVKKLCIFGDGFYELITDPTNPKDGILKMQELPPESMYKIVTTKGRVVEYQQSKEGPDYQALTKSDVTKSTEQELMQSTSIRFAPSQVVHIGLGDDRRTFYPYGQSLIEPARGPAHQLRLMEDAMMVYRLCLVGDTRVRTETGYKYIRDMKHGDSVFSYDQDGNIFSSKVINFMENGVKDVYRVRSKHVEITGTANHPVLVNRDGTIQYVEIQNLIVKSDKLINTKRDEEIEVRIPEIQEEQRSSGNTMCKTKLKFKLPACVDEDFARLFGFMIGDGSVRRQGLCVGSKKYAAIMGKFFGKIGIKGDDCFVRSGAASRLFVKMGYATKAGDRRMPAWVFTAPSNIRRAFVEGISDADVCERHTKSGVSFSSIELGNKKLVEDIKEVWSSIGLASGNIRTRRGKTKKYYAVTISNKEVREFENVLSVRYSGQEEVYDITVDNEIHNFIANGTPVHNSRAPERRVFYIDVGQLPPFKAEAFVDRMKDQFRKKKVPSGRGTGANAVEERWHAPAADEDYWIPIRPSANTRIETLPGAQNLGEIDDALYFRNKLFTALNFPKNYMNNEDTGATRITLSAQDARFARMVERIQASVEDAILEVCERHLEMQGYPSEAYEDLRVEMTPPSSWKELSEAEIMNNRINVVTTLKSSMLMSDYDLLTKYLRISEDEAERIISRNKIQKLEDLKIQIVGQNPQLLGVGTPSSQPNDMEMGTEAGGPVPNLEDQGGEQPEMPEETGQPEIEQGEQQEKTPVAELPDPTEEEIKKYNLGLEDYSRTIDSEEIDWSEEG